MFRSDSFFTLFLFGFIRKFFPLSYDHIPILMYHSISTPQETLSHPYFEVNTSATMFRMHMEHLKTYGYSTVGLETFNNASLKKPRDKRVIITFDDGFKDFYTEAFPILREFGFTATVFLPTVFSKSESPGIIGKYHLSWKEVKILSTQNIEFGSHTVSHRLLVNEPFSVIHTELTESKKEIEDNIGCPVRFFSYPYAFPEHKGRFVTGLRVLLPEAGYSCGVTTRIGTAKIGDDRFFLRRIPINSFDDKKLFKAKLEGAYNWLGYIQYLKKTFNFNLSLKNNLS